MFQKEQGTRTSLEGRGKGRDHIITEGQHRKLTLWGQSLEVTFAYARGWNYTTPQ